MKRFLQRVEDGRYFAESGDWTDNLSQAYSFQDSPAAVKFCLEKHLPPVRLLLESQDPPVHLSLPLFVSHLDNETDDQQATLCTARLRNRMLRVAGGPLGAQARGGS
jgi:hypothetical protein